MTISAHLNILPLAVNVQKHSNEVRKKGRGGDREREEEREREREREKNNAI